MRHLIPMLLLCSACASVPASRYAAPSAAPTASATLALAPDVRLTLDAAQAQATVAGYATQAVIDASNSTQYAIDTQRAGEQAATQAVIDGQLTQQQAVRDALALSMTVDAYEVSKKLTQLSVHDRENSGTATAQARASELVEKIDEQNKARSFAGMSNTLWGMFYGVGILCLFGLPAFGVFQWIQRKRWAPYALPGGAEMIDARATPALPEPKWSASEIEALDFLAIGAAYIDTHPEQPASQIPSCEKLEKWGASKFIHGDDWQRARNLLGALAASSNRGTFCRDYTVKGLHQALLDKKHPIPYPNPDTAPHSEHSGGILEG